MRNYIRHLKYPELVEFYRNYEWSKPKYSTFLTRVIRHGYTKDDAIDINFQKSNSIANNPNIYGDGRICKKCNIHKPRSDFNKDRSSKTGYTTKCKACASIIHAEYRLSGGYEKEREQKKKARTLYIGELVYFNDYDSKLATIGKLEYWEVMDKKPRQGYKIKSTVTGYYKSLDPANTKQKFFRVNNLYPK